MADEEFKDYGDADKDTVIQYLMDEFNLTQAEAFRLIVKHRDVLHSGIIAYKSATYVGDKIIEQEPAL